MVTEGGAPSAAPAAESARVARALHDRDPSAQWLGIELVEAAAGRAVVEMSVRPEMCNGHRICHGGVIFTLADSAMAFASNSHNETAVAAAASVDYLQPVPEGSMLRAEASERTLRGRTGIYDVAVTTADGAIVALFRGRTQRVGGAIVAGWQADGKSSGEVT